MKLADALKYGVAEAKGLRFDNSGNSEASNRLHSAIREFVHKDNRTALAGIVDLLQDNDHPLASVIGKLFTGEGREIEPNRSGLLGHFARRPADDPSGLHLTNYTGLQWDPESGRGANKPVIGTTALRFKDGQNFFHLYLQGDRPEGEAAKRREFLVPATEDEIEDYAHQMREIAPEHSNAILNGDHYGNSDFALNPVNENYVRTGVGLPPLPAEEPVHHQSLSQALKYITARPEEWTHHLADPQKRDLHLIWADVLNDNGMDGLAHKVREESKTRRFQVPQPQGEESDARQVIFANLNHRHPSPAIRALAEEYYTGPLDFGLLKDNKAHSLLVHALRQSPREADQDAGVYLAPVEIPHSQHPAQKHFKQLDSHLFANAGLMPKLVGDTLYLMDWNHPEAESYGAPAIRYHAHIGDRQDLDGLVAHAEELRQQQEAL